VRPGWRTTGPYLPDSFIAGLALFAVGSSINALQLRSDAADDVAVMAWLALCSSLIGAAAGALWTRSRREFSDFVEASTAALRAERLFVRAGLAVSALVCAWFIHAVFSSGSIAALLSLGSLLDDSSSLLTARKMITAGTEEYFAPGYVKQFRDILIPVFLSAFVAMNRRFYKSIQFWLVVIVAVVAMLMTGQRFILVVLAGTVLVASYYVVGLRLRALVFAGLLMTATYGGLTVLLGRLPEGTTPMNAAGAIIGNIVDRAVITVPRQNTLTHPVWKQLGPTMGSSWLDELSGIAPGGARVRFSNVLHSRAGGSEEGNSPLALPIDSWLAWGWGGLLILPLLFSVALSAIDRILLSRDSAIFFGLKVYLAIVVPLFYSPYLFILYGGAVAAVLIAVVPFVRPVRIAPHAVRAWTRSGPARDSRWVT